MRRASWLVAALMVIPAALHAQKCVGQAAWSSGSVKVGASIGNGGPDVAGGISTGKDQGFFVGAGGGLDIEESQPFIQVNAGKELSKTLGDKISICPIASAAYYLKKDGFSAIHALGGLSGGYPVTMSSSKVALILTGSAQVGIEKISIDGYCALPGADCSSVFAQFGIGAGFVFNDRISLAPQILIPTEGDVGFLIIANIAVGKKK